MKVTAKAQSAFTFIELLVVLAIVAILAGILRSGISFPKASTKRINCVSNLKLIGTSYRIFASDHDDLFPNEIASNEGSFAGMLSAAESFKCLDATNDYFSIKALVCPAERQRVAATNLSTLSNSNLSYFSCLNASQTNLGMFLAGDRNLTFNAVSLSAFTVKTNDSLGWTAELHKMQGNVGLADGSVQQVTSNKLTELVRTSGAEQRLSLP